MEKIVYGGKNVYGYDIGILMLDSKFPRIRGDVGNAKTWDFPVLYKTVVGGTPKKVVLELTEDDIEPFILAAKELEQAGVKAITTSCGFLALFQKQLANAVNIPVFTSALLMVPFVKRFIGENRKIGILTANSKTLSDAHLRAVGIRKEDVVIKGLEDKEVFTDFTVQNWDRVGTEKCRAELLEATEELLHENDDIGAMVLECTNMPPYTKDIQQVAGMPVFDIVTLVNFVHSGIAMTEEL